MSQGCGRERWFGTETRKSRSAEAFAKSYLCSDGSEVAWDPVIPLGKEHSRLWCLGESLQQQATAVRKGDASRVWAPLAESEAVPPHPFFFRAAEAGSASSLRSFSAALVSPPAGLCNEPHQQTPPGWKPETAHLLQTLLEAEQKKLDGWYNKTTKDYWLWFAFQRLRSAFKCLGLHLSPSYRPAQASTFMVQDIFKGLSLYFTAVRYQTLSFLMVIQSKQAVKRCSKCMWSCGSLQPQAGHPCVPGSSAFPVLVTLSHCWHASAAGIAWEG